MILILTAQIGFFWTWQTALIALAIGMGIATAVMLIKRSKLKSVRFARAACSYVREGSFKITKRLDAFLFANTTRIPRAQNSAPSRGGGRRR